VKQLKPKSIIGPAFRQAGHLPRCGLQPDFLLLECSPLSPIFRPQKSHFSQSEIAGATMDNHLVSLTDIRQAARKHWILAVAALLIGLFLEFWFYNYPPRGVLSEDTLIIGSVLGEPLVKFDTLWTRIINDDAKMLEILRVPELSESGNGADDLALVASLRRNLRYLPVGEVMVKIGLVRPGYDGRTFLNRFSAYLLEQLRVLGEETLKTRRESVRLRYASLAQQSWVISGIFGLTGFKDLLKDFSNFETLFTQNLRATDSPGLWQSIGWLFLNSWLNDFHALRNSYNQHFSEDFKLLDIYPRMPRIISSPQAVSVPVQPFHQLIYILVPCAIGLVYLSLLMLLSHKRADRQA